MESVCELKPMGPDRRPSRSWSCGSWIYNYLCNLCISPLKLWVRIPFRRGVLNTTLCDKVCQWLATRRWFSLYNIMWYSLSVTCDTSVVFSSYYGFLHQYNFPPRYSWNIVVRGLKHHICQGKPTFTHKYVLFLNVL